MAFRITSLAAATALLAASSMASAPALAGDLHLPRTATSVPAHAGWSSDDEVYQDHRYRRGRHRDGVSFGDVLVGALIIGGIAAVVDSANNDKNDRYRDRDYPERRNDSRYNENTGLDRAAQMCVREIERDARVDRVDTVNRTAEGWNVAGRLYNGDGFSCNIGRDGRIESVDYGAGGSAYDSSSREEDSQYDDNVYARARMQTDGSQSAAASDDYSGSQSAYPGGPVEGDDGRYSTAD